MPKLLSLPLLATSVDPNWARSEGTSAALLFLFLLGLAVGFVAARH